MSSRLRPGVFANGGGRMSTGVLSESGCVRSMTRTEPSARPLARAARVSVAMECLLQPFGTDVGVDFGVQHERAIAALKPLLDRLQIVHRPDGQAAAAGPLGQRGEV